MLLLSLPSLAFASELKLPALPQSPVAAYRLQIDFQDHARVRLDAQGRPRSSKVDLSALRALQAQRGFALRPLVDLPADQVEALEARAAELSGREQPDLLGMYEVVVRSDNDAALVKLGQALEVLPGVERVQIVTLGEPPPADYAPTTPDYTGLQTFQDPWPSGLDIDLLRAWGITGAGLMVTDVEYGWDPTHEDLVDRSLNLEPGQTVPAWVFANGWEQHGTAALGEISAVANAYGCTGTLPDAISSTHPEWTDAAGSRRAAAITSAASNSIPGDVIMLEMQASGPGGGYGPAELDFSVWNATRVATDAGITVVAAAGNGAQNLDSAPYATYRSWGDSGAIIVGAGSSNSSHTPLSFSTYGTRVDLQGWGENVFTLGYGSYAMLGGDLRQSYTAWFNGTSSATPGVTTAALAVQEYAWDTSWQPLPPWGVRAVLIDSGVPQGAGVEVGPFPDLLIAFILLDDDWDWSLDWWYGGEDCDDYDSSVYPGAPDPWDGIDQDCDGWDG
jgi:hypothetical protein